MDITSPQARTEQGQSSQAQANFSDSSGPLFHMYINMTEGEDEKMTNRWQKDADGIIIFTGLFSAALAAFLTVSVQDLKSNPQDTTAFYLANIYQLLADPNISRASILATPAQPPVFSPSNSAVLVNSLWFLSLVISLTSALLATMLQQWARRYLTIIQPPLYSPHKRASIRAFFANGVETFHLPWSVEALPALLHLSLFLFFTGLAIYLFNINHTVFSVVVWWVGLAGGIYGCVTLMPIFWHDSPYYSPLSSSAWLFFNFTFSAIRRFHYFLLNHQWPHVEGYLLFEDLTKIVQEAGSKLSAKITDDILTWTLRALEEDKDLEQFFEAIPGYCSSNVGYGPFAFTKFDKLLADTFQGFIYRTLSSSLFLEEDKKRRVIICAKATDAAQLSETTMYTLGNVFSFDVDLFRSVDMWQSLISTNGGQVPGLCSQGIIAGVIANTSERDERWEALAKDLLGVSEEDFGNYLANGDNVLLANLIHITRLLFRSGLKNHETLDPLFSLCSLRIILKSISEFGIENTLPGLQHDFCDLWNEITREAHDRGFYDTPVFILSPIRHRYIALHEGTDAAPTAFDASTRDFSEVLGDPFSYPLCNIPGHRPIATTSDSPNACLNLFTELAVSSFPASTEVDNRVHSVGESSLHDVLHAPLTIQSSHRSLPDNVDPADTSLDIITQGLTDKDRTISPTSNSELEPHPAPAVSIFIPHPSFSPPLSSIPDPQTNAGLGVVPDIPSSSFSGTVSNDTPLSLPSTFPTSISLPPPLDITEQSRESAMSVPDLAADASRLQVSPDSVSSSGGIDRPA